MCCNFLQAQAHACPHLQCLTAACNRRDHRRHAIEAVDDEVSGQARVIIAAGTRKAEGFGRDIQRILRLGVLLLPLIAPPAGCGKKALKAVQRHVQQQKVEQHGRPACYARVPGAVDQQGERRRVFLIVGIGVPLRKTQGEAFLKPALQPGLRFLHMLSARPAIVGEGLLRVELPRQILAGGEYELVVLAPVAHAVPARLIHRVFEAQHRPLHAGERLFADQPRKITEAAQYAHQAEIGAVIAPVNEIKYLQDLPFVGAFAPG